MKVFMLINHYSGDVHKHLLELKWAFCKFCSHEVMATLEVRGSWCNTWFISWEYEVDPSLWILLCKVFMF